MIDMVFLPMLPELGRKSLDRILKNYLHKNKRLNFRKNAVLVSAILLKMVFTSKVIFSIFIKLFRTIFYQNNSECLLPNKFMLEM